MVNIAKDEFKYRIFISYYHEDVELAGRISSMLNENGLQLILDKSFASGHGFNDQIKNYIAHARVFMPVLTNESITPSWIQQEIGYPARRIKGYPGVEKLYFIRLAKSACVNLPSWMTLSLLRRKPFRQRGFRDLRLYRL